MCQRRCTFSPCALSKVRVQTEQEREVAAAAAAAAGFSRDSPGRGARGARVERINPIVHRPIIPPRFQRGHP